MTKERAYGLGRADLGACVIALILVAAFMLKSALVAPPAPDPDQSGFDHARAIGRLAVVLGDERPHPVDSAANDAVRARIVRILSEMGYAPEVRDDFACRLAQRWRTVTCARVRNVIAVAGPRRGLAVMLAAHYDSVVAGPGASDDGAGVAVILEIAQLMAERPPARPVIFLLTDGEESGLLGAESFMRADPYADRIGAVVNLEARGVRGPATMFETGAPNGADAAAFAEVKRGRGNSLAADIYRMMPNDTDVSEFRRRDVDILNYAYTDGFAFYHTPRDAIAAMDHSSLAHMGASALQSVDAFLKASPHGPERSAVFTDVVGAVTLAAPRWAGLALLVFGFGAAMICLIRSGDEKSGIAAAATAPVAAMAAAAGLAFCLFSIIDALRASELFYFASPSALSAVYAAAGMLSGAVAAAALSRRANPPRRLAAVWAWFCALGLGAFMLAPGSAALFAPPAALFAAAVASAFGSWRIIRWASIPATLLAFLLFLPTLHLAEINLGLRAAWGSAPIAAMLALLAFASLGEARVRAGMLVSAAWLAIAFAQSLVSAPYSKAAPQPINIEHVVDADSGESAITLAARDPAPVEMIGAAAFTPTTIAGFAERPGVSAPTHDSRAIGVAQESEATPEGRRVRLRLQANGADEIIVIAPAEAGVSRLTIGERSFDMVGDGRAVARCVGRSCATFEVAADVAAAPAPWRIIGLRYGLGAEASAIAAARPESATPIQAGDVRIIERRRAV